MRTEIQFSNAKTMIQDTNDDVLSNLPPFGAKTDMSGISKDDEDWDLEYIPQPKDVN